MTATCPRCGWNNSRLSAPKGIFDAVARCFFLAPVRCRSCRHRFHRFSIERYEQRIAVPVGVLAVLPEPAPSRPMLYREASLSSRTAGILRAMERTSAF